MSPGAVVVVGGAVVGAVAAVACVDGVVVVRGNRDLDDKPV